jgi:GTP-binding protein
MEQENSQIKAYVAKRLPIVALIGRPSVGKSTIFNRILHKNLVITDQTMGVTRDRIMQEFLWNGKEFTLMDTGGIAPEEGTIQNQVSIQSEIAIGIADIIIFVVDSKIGPTKEDKYVAKKLRNSNKDVILVANKSDNKDFSEFNFHQLGFGEPFHISATSGRNLADLLDMIAVKLSAHEEDESEAKQEKQLVPNITIAGRPNVGKSSLLNALLGESRATVSNVAGTTRDAVDTPILYEDKPFLLVDTAGIKKRYKYDQQLEFVTVKRAEQAIHRSDLVLLIIDGKDGVLAEDQRLARFIADEGKACIVIINKVDLVEDKTAFTDRLQYELRFIDYAPIIKVSALTKKNIQKIFPTVLRILESYTMRISTGKFNKWLAEATSLLNPTAHRGKVLKILYGTQTMSRPPTFQLFVNHENAASTAYIRYLENSLRKDFGFDGTPIKLYLKERS